MKAVLKDIQKFLCALALCLTLVLTGACPVGAKGSKLVALTFDDGPGRYTEQLLDGLKERGAKVTFFTTGVNGSVCGLTNQPQALEREIAEGHEVANHTYNHVLGLPDKSAKKIRSEVQKVDDLITKAYGTEYKYLVRIPGGEYSDKIKDNVASPLILWSVDTEDWRTRDAAKVYNAIVKQASDGDIILCHDIYETTVQGALKAITTLQKRGYEFVTVSELMRRKGVSMEDGVRYYGAMKKKTIYGAYEAPGILSDDGTVTLSYKDQGAKLTLLYTTDGSDPVRTSQAYTEPFKVTEDCTVKVMGVDAYGTLTPVAEAEVKRPLTFWEKLGRKLNNVWSSFTSLFK